MGQQEETGQIYWEGFGTLSYVWNRSGLRHVTFSKSQSAEICSPLKYSPLENFLTEYREGRRPSRFFPLDLSGFTSFQQQVWHAMDSIPYGEVRSYQWIADQIGNSGAVRAVGQAVGRNPVPLVLPCHRVVASDGSLGGFSCGIEWKKKLLALEGVRV